MRFDTLTALCWTNLRTPAGVQQKLMRHSDVRTTMNICGSAFEETRRQANTLVAGKLLTEVTPRAHKNGFNNSRNDGK
jgi:hypothetical protein